MSLRRRARRYTGGGTPAPSLNSTNGTTSPTTLTVSAGVLKRDGITVAAPYTTTVDDMEATFWAQNGTARSASIKIASGAAPAVSYTAYRLSWIRRQFDTSTDVQIQDIRVKDIVGNVIALAAVNPVTTSFTIFSGTLGNMIDGNYSTSCGIRGTAPVSFELNFAASSTIGSVEIKGGTGGTPPADMVMYGKRASDGVWVDLGFSEVWPGGTNGWGYVYDTWRPFVLASAGPQLTATRNVLTNLVTLGISNFVSTCQIRLVDDSEIGYPVALIDAWTTKVNGNTLAATTGGVYRTIYRDNANTSDVRTPVSATNVPGTRPLKYGTNVGEVFGRPYYSYNFDFFADQFQYIHDTTVTGGPMNGQSIAFDGVYQDRYGRIMAIPAGASQVTIGLSWYPHVDALGQYELLTSGLCTVANMGYGNVWLFSGSNPPTIIGTGPNGGVVVEFTSQNMGGFGLGIYSIPGGATPTASMWSLRKLGASSTDVLLPSVVTELDKFEVLRWAQCANEGIHYTSMPYPLRSSYATYQARLDALSWANRRMAGIGNNLTDAIIASKKTPHVTVPFGFPDSYLTAQAAYMATRLDPSITVYFVAPGNECFWNRADPYIPTTFAMMLLAAQKGLMGDVPDYVQRTVLVNTSNNLTVAETYALNDYMFDFSEFKGKLWKKISSTTGPTTLPAYSIGVGDANSDWECVATHFQTAGMNGVAMCARGYAYEGERIRAAVQAGFGSRLTVVPCLEVMAIGVNALSYGNSDPTENPLRAALHTPLYAAGGEAYIDKCKGIYGAYWASYVFGYGANPAIAPWNGTTADINAFLAAALPAEIDPGIVRQGRELRGVFADLSAEIRTVNGVPTRYSPAAFHFGQYEAGQNKNTPSDAAVQLKIEQSNRLASCEAYITSYLNAIAVDGGWHIEYQQGTINPTNPGGSNWSWQTKIPTDPAERGMGYARDRWLGL